MSRSSFCGILGGQIEEMRFSAKKVQALDNENYPATGAMREAKKGCKKHSSCFNCPFPVNTCPSFVGAVRAYPCQGIRSMFKKKTRR